MRRGDTSFTDSGLKCSFCHKRQSVVGKLISSPSDYPRAYICDECVQVCFSILQDDVSERDSGANSGWTFTYQPHAESGSDTHPSRPTETPPSVLDHPLAAQLLTAVERWYDKESQSGDAKAEVAAMRAIAEAMFGKPE